jgi:glycosyltransferase involved in cell wall biosynthesis
MQKTDKPKVIVSVTNDLTTDQRVHKVCSTLRENGYEVQLIGRKFKNSPSLRREYATYRMRLLFKKGFCFYAEYNIRLFLHLLFVRADIFLANDTDTLLANYFISRIRGKKLLFDAHEMFPESPELVDRKRIKLFWTKMEDYLFPRLEHAYTVCRSIADSYQERYGIRMRVIRNIPFAEQRTTAKTGKIRQEKKILLYQGAVNMGRGIEYVIDAMPYLDECIFYIVGSGDIVEDLQRRVKEKNVTDRVVFTGKIPFEELSSYTQCADIGMNLLENKGLNYYYSLPNRIFDYIRNNVPVLSCDFPEIRKIVSHYRVGQLTNCYEPEHLATRIREMLSDEKNESGFRAANAELTWENESKILLQIIAEVSQT